MCDWVSICFSCGTQTHSCDLNSVTGDPDLIRIHTRCGPIYWRFEDWSMGRSEDSYRFVQWRSDGDSDPKLLHFMWVFALVSFPYLSLSVLFICFLYHFIWPSDIFDQYDYSYHFIWH